MATELASAFPPLIAERIRSAHAELARRWLERLKDVLSVDANEIFPSDQILDHIPALIREIADYVAAESDAVATNTAIQSKAHELGELRFTQQASVHQLLREYRVLGAVIAQFIQEETERTPAIIGASDAVGVLTRLNDAVFVLLQMTVDTFVGRYTARIDEQTTRLEGFNRMVSHELRQPLSAIQNAVELLGMDDAHDEAKRAHFVQLANRNVRRLADLVRMLGALVRPDQDNMQVQTIDLAKTVADACRELGEMAQNRGVALHNRVAPQELTLDVGRFDLVLVNLLSNGIKYRDPAKTDRFVEVSTRSADGQIEVRVRDNGLGIPASNQSSVFRRFFRAHAARDQELGNDGVGLGLAIVGECVRALGGTIVVESQEGVGTTFLVTLPARHA